MHQYIQYAGGDACEVHNSVGTVIVLTVIQGDALG